jgi:prevent-host-death family protein
MLPMKTVVAFEDKKSLAALLDLVEKGDEVTITRAGRPVARLVASEPDFDREEAHRTAAEIKEMRKGVTLGGIALRDLIEDGRR